MLGFKEKEIKRAVDVYMFHIDGQVRGQWGGGDYELAPGDLKICTIAHQTDGSHLLYTREWNPNLSKYFSNHQVIAHRHWNPAFHMNGDQLLDCQQDENLFLIGDHNVCGLEDAYITGVYAAKRIISSRPMLA